MNLNILRLGEIRVAFSFQRLAKEKSKKTHYPYPNPSPSKTSGDQGESMPQKQKEQIKIFHRRDQREKNAATALRPRRKKSAGKRAEWVGVNYTYGDTVIYNPNTNEFAVVDKNGTILTYFKPDPAVHGYETNLDYYNAQK